MNEEQQQGTSVDSKSLLQAWAIAAFSANESLSTFHHHDTDIPAIHLRHFRPASSSRATDEISRTCYINRRTTGKKKNNTPRHARGMRHATQ
jgi:hypothetical protein